MELGKICVEDKCAVRGVCREVELCWRAEAQTAKEGA